MITLLLADDHQVFAEGLGMVLDAEDDVEVLGVARDGEEALRLLDRHLPDVLLLDAHMPRTDLCEVLRVAKAKAPGTKVVVLSADTRRETVDLAMEAGADGFLAKDLAGWQLATAIRKLLEGSSAPVTPALPPRPVRDAGAAAGLAQQPVDEQPTAHADTAVDAPHRQLDSALLERLAPSQDVLIHAVGEGAVEVEQERWCLVHRAALSSLAWVPRPRGYNAGRLFPTRRVRRGDPWSSRGWQS